MAFAATRLRADVAWRLTLLVSDEMMTPAVTG